MGTILDSDYALVEFFEDDSLVQITWKKIKLLSIEDYQNAFNHALEF